MHHVVEPAVKLLLVMMITSGITAVISVLIAPILFNFYVIPRLEKRIGRKLEFSPMWSYTCIFEFYSSKYMDLIDTVAYRYFAWKIKGDPMAKLNFISKGVPGTLDKVDYDIKAAPRFEVFICLTFFFNLVLCLVSFIVAMITMIFIPAT